MRFWKTFCELIMTNPDRVQNPVRVYLVLTFNVLDIYFTLFLFVLVEFISNLF